MEQLLSLGPTFGKIDYVSGGQARFFFGRCPDQIVSHLESAEGVVLVHGGIHPELHGQVLHPDLLAEVVLVVLVPYFPRVALVGC